MSGNSAGERTEKPTKRRKEKARKQGQVARSNELNIAFSVITLFAVLNAAWDGFVKSASAMVKNYLSSGYLAASDSINKAAVMHVYRQALADGLRIIWPVLLLALLVGVLVHVFQTGLLFTGETLKPKFNRINPIEGFKRIFSTRSLIELVKSALKLALLCYIAYSAYKGIIARLPTMMNTDIKQAFTDIMHTALKLGIRMGAGLGAVAAFDYLYQRLKYEKDLMMTKQEVKEEYKQLEGDPKIKSRIRQKQRQMSRLRMMRRLPEADVVITNPTHYAVAIRYKEKEDSAPVVLAKGKDHVALKIKEKAKEYGIEIVENKPVAQALYKSCELDQEIPSDMYKAVAEILVYVYRMKRKGGRK
ncbi:MAG: flagellar biosynthesis protein FlhB [Oscillospiraceae bacterium]|jgi:flagellar biosynthetic protein FlhB